MGAGGTLTRPALMMEDARLAEFVGGGDNDLGGGTVVDSAGAGAAAGAGAEVVGA